MTRPYGGHYLTEEQKKMAEENVPIVWWFIKNKALKIIEPHEIDECASELLFGLCLAAELFNPIKGCTFMTYANCVMKNFLYRYLSLRDKFNQRFICTDWVMRGENFDNKNESLNEPICEEYEKPIEWNNIKWIFDYITMNDIEEQIIFFYYEQKKSYKEIGKLLGVSREYVRLNIQNIAQRLREALEKNNITILDLI